MTNWSENKRVLAQVRLPEDECARMSRLADVIEEVTGADFDTAAQLAQLVIGGARERRQGEELGRYIEGPGYTGRRRVPAGWAPAEVRKRDALDHPHDEECPKCGRRQWTEETAQEVCQACGYDITDEVVGP
jgi:ribosomal protein L37E